MRLTMRCNKSVIKLNNCNFNFYRTLAIKFMLNILKVSTRHEEDMLVESVSDMKMFLRLWEKFRGFALLEGFGYIMCTGGGCSNSSKSVGSYRWSSSSKSNESVKSL